MTPDHTDTVRVSLDDVAPSTAVVEATAAVTDTPPTDCPPLGEHVDPDALDKVFADRSSGELTFTYHDCEVTVDNDSAVIAEPE